MGEARLTREGVMLSLVRGESHPALKRQTIGAALAEAIERAPAAEALVSAHQGVRWTMREFGERVDALAAGLLELDLAPGDRVGIWAPNCAEWTQTQFAAARAGLILVTINPAYRVSELEFTLNKVGVKALVIAERFKTSDYVAMVEQVRPRTPALKHAIKIGGAPRQGWLLFSDIAQRASTDALEKLVSLTQRLSPDDPINIQFTSGTTGLPKGATLTHVNILNNGYFVGRGMGLRDGDRLCIPVPLYHCFGMVMGNLACIQHGAAMIYPNDGFDPQATLRVIEAERCTHVHGVPTMFIAMLEHPAFARFDLQHLRGGLMAGAPCPMEVMRRLIDEVGLTDISIAYGMTETSPVSFQTALEDPIERRVGTVGRVQPHLEVKIVDLDGAITARGVAGEVCTRGYSVMPGYWDDAEKTAEAIDAEGWMHTGDLGVIDADGYCQIVGRIKDMIIRGGENISPREIEEFLYTHEQIEAAQVVGLPDPRYGEEVCAWIKLRGGGGVTEDEVRAFCRERIAHYKVPRYIQFVDEFPMTVTGKVQKFLIRQQMIEELKLAP